MSNSKTRNKKEDKQVKKKKHEKKYRNFDRRLSADFLTIPVEKKIQIYLIQNIRVVSFKNCKYTNKK